MTSLSMGILAYLPSQTLTKFQLNSMLSSPSSTFLPFLPFYSAASYCYSTTGSFQTVATQLSFQSSQSSAPAETSGVCKSKILSFSLKIAGLWMAPLATMTPEAPEKERYLLMSRGEKRSPEPSTGILIKPVSRSYLTINQRAGTLDSSAAVLGCIDIQCTPVSCMLITYLSVSSYPFSTLILHDTLIWPPNRSTSALMISYALSGLRMSAAPMPPCTENFLGQPMFTSTPEISGSSFYTAANARSLLFVPIWRMKRDLSWGRRRRTREQSLAVTQSIVSSSQFSTRTQVRNFLSMISSENTKSAPYSKARSLKGSVFQWHADHRCEAHFTDYSEGIFRVLG
ncbi:hypothetical protein FGO68_gene9470 [Halteria grandinella]|uniref:Uncharacterized protein n=1 Tax=Halteria grandinella TaxID=5974 RepID=A0A8J8TAU4_HALGN|nr:hypothetical protein FGO68_gene9470 [Halteria grandinella]